MRPSLAACAAALSLTASAAAAAPYTIFVYETLADLALRDQASPAAQAYWAAWSGYSDLMTEAGAIRGGAPLLPPQAGRMFRMSPPVGPQLSGYFVIEAPDLEAAAKLAGQAPSIARGGGAEVRGTYAAPNMTAR